MVLPQRKEAALRACGTQPEVCHTFFASGVAGQNPSAHPSRGSLPDLSQDRSTVTLMYVPLQSPISCWAKCDYANGPKG